MGYLFLPYMELSGLKCKFQIETEKTGEVIKPLNVSSVWMNALSAVSFCN